MRKNILLIFVLFFTLCCSCFKDDTNTDYKELKKPVLLINDEDEHAFKENRTDSLYVISPLLDSPEKAFYY